MRTERGTGRHDDETTGEASTRQHSGGYDFGGYVPGADYFPPRRRRIVPVLAGIVLVAVVVAVIIAVR